MCVVLSLAVLLSVSAWALPGPNSMGIFLENPPTVPLQFCVDRGPGQVEFHVLLMNPEVPGMSQPQVAAVEFVLEIQNSSVLFGDWDYHEGVPVVIEMDANSKFYSIGYTTPLTPVGGVVDLMTYTGFLSSDTVPVVFILKGYPDTGSFPDSKRFGYAASETDLVEAVAVTGDAYDEAYGAYVSNPVLILNNDGSWDDFCQNVISNETKTWSNVKSMYR